MRYRIGRIPHISVQPNAETWQRLRSKLEAVGSADIEEIVQWSEGHRHQAGGKGFVAYCIRNGWLVEHREGVSQPSVVASVATSCQRSAHPSKTGASASLPNVHRHILARTPTRPPEDQERDGWTTTGRRSAVAAFVDYWSHCGLAAPPFVHPADAPFVSPEDFAFDLLPMPINGSLAEAEVVILMLNPGLSPEDYEWERNGTFRDGLLRSLLQNHRPADCPFVYLDPGSAMHPGARYWIGGPWSGGGRQQQKLRDVVAALAIRDEVPFRVAQMHVARKMAVLQLCPYHSRTKPRQRLLTQLPSCSQARRLAHALVNSGEKLVVVTRSVGEWGFTGPVESENLIVYPSCLGASAPLTLASTGGAAILRRLSPVPRITT